MKRNRVAAFVAVSCVLLIGAAHSARTAAADPCPNEAFRTGVSAALPDCRVYEMVSPLDKNGGDIRALPPASGLYTSFKQASLDGGRITYTSSTAFGDAVAGPYSSQYLSSRGEQGWLTHGISPPRSTAVFEGKGGLPAPNWDAESLFEAFTLDLCNAWVRDTNLEPLTPDGLVGFVNLYRRSNCDEDGYEALTRHGPFGTASEYLSDSGELASDVGATGPGLRFQGASSDLSHQVFISGAALLPDEVGSEVKCSTTTPAATISYRWLRNGVEIEGASAGRYTLTDADQGNAIQCQVLAVNSNAGSTQVANAARVVAPAPQTLPPRAPDEISAPTASAVLTVGGAGGQTLTCDPRAEEWRGSPAFSYHWYRDAILIDGATASTYTVTEDDLATPAAFQCAVTATNPGASVVKVSENRPTSPRLNPAAPIVNANMNKTWLYDLHNGELKLVGVLPDGKPNPENSVAGTLGSPVVTRQSTIEHAVSKDGRRIFWTSKSGSAIGPGQIYVRIDGKETLPVSEVSARYWTAAVDGSRVLFTVDEELYEFDVDKALSGHPQPERLIAGQVPGLLGAADDLSRIYFVSEQALAGGSVEGEWNLYLEEEGVIRLVAILSHDEEVHAVGLSPIRPEPIRHASRVTADGRHIAFQSVTGLAGYDNVDPATGKRHTEVYRYDADTNELTCVSCNPSGEPPSGGPPISIPYNAFEEELTANPSFNAKFGEAATLPPWERDYHASRVLSEDGNRVFFHSHEALDSRDTNGVQDVYQWEAQGTGSCQEQGGCVDLISTGTSPQVSEFIDASVSGNDVFISTTSGIDPRDEGAIDIYDARVGGGFPTPPLPPNCLGDACQSIPAAPHRPTPAGVIFTGPGDPPLRSNCKALARRAARLARRARRIGSHKLAKRAKRVGKRAKRCRRVNRGGSR